MIKKKGLKREVDDKLVLRVTDTWSIIKNDLIPWVNDVVEKIKVLEEAYGKLRNDIDTIFKFRKELYQDTNKLKKVIKK